MPETPGFRRRVFVVMPFGVKEVPRKPRVEAAPADEMGEMLTVDFTAVYQSLFHPALEAAGLQPFRADDETSAGDILKDMFAELVTADFVLADLSILNANVFYELGIRHMAGPRGVICVHAGWAPRPFDVGPLRTFPYEGRLFQAPIGQSESWKAEVAAEVAKLARILRDAVDADRTTEGSPVYGSLPNLAPPNVSKIGTAKFKHYQAQSDEWDQRITIASREGHAEDILTLAGDVPSPYYRRKLLRQCGEALLSLGRFAQSEKVFKELCEDLDGIGSLEELRVKSQLALLANRLGRTREAEEKLSALVEKSPGDAEAQGLLGRVYKDMWRTAWSKVETAEGRLAAAQQKAAVARKSLVTYEGAVRRDLNSYYNGINVVALAALLEHVARAAGRPLKKEVSDIDSLQSVVHLAAEGKLADRYDGVWARATLGELSLVRGETAEALEHYEQVTADPSLTWFNIHSMYEQVQLFQSLGFHPEAVAPVAALLEQRLTELPHPSSFYTRVAICSGHMIDAPTRPAPRFPNARAEDVRVKIAAQLEKWQIGTGDLAICGGACGADLLFAEECLRRGAKIRLLLAQETPEFVRDSVRQAGDQWVERFYAVRDQAEVAVQPERLGKSPHDVSIYARNNLWIINSARVESPDSARTYALLVWDGKDAGDGPGGTADFASRVRSLGSFLKIIDPLTIP